MKSPMSNTLRKIAFREQMLDDHLLDGALGQVRVERSATKIEEFDERGSRTWRLVCRSLLIESRQVFAKLFHPDP